MPRTGGEFIARRGTRASLPYGDSPTRQQHAKCEAYREVPAKVKWGLGSGSMSPPIRLKRDDVDDMCYLSTIFAQHLSQRVSLFVAASSTQII